MADEPEPCHRCGEQPAVDLEGFCGHCHWAIRAEIEEGMAQFRILLKNHAAFHAWETVKGLATGLPESPESE